jgi:hypothetical protein
MVLMYPNPTTFSKHIVVPLNSKGDQIGQLLSGDPTLQHLAVKYGFRTQDTAYQAQFDKDHHLVDPPQLINVVEPPTFNELEYMIGAIDKLYTQQKLP